MDESEDYDEEEKENNQNDEEALVVDNFQEISPKDQELSLIHI